MFYTIKGSIICNVINFCFMKGTSNRLVNGRVFAALVYTRGLDFKDNLYLVVLLFYMSHVSYRMYTLHIMWTGLD